MLVTKSTGEQEEFSEQKILGSIKRIGIAQDLQREVVRHVESTLYNGIPTSEIYHHVLEYLNKTVPYAKAKYNLKRAIMDLGPTGYPFEDYLASILKTKGYQTTTRSILQGKCITHEIDVVAEKNQQRIMIEAKFHNTFNIKTDVHVALYTKARFDDIKETNNLDQGWIVSNTRITTDAIAYSKCGGITTISWDYPQQGNLKDMIEESRLFPVTALSSLSHTQKQQLVAHNFAMCQDICKDTSFLDELNLSNEKREEVLEEAGFVCGAST